MGKSQDKNEGALALPPGVAAPIKPVGDDSTATTNQSTGGAEPGDTPPPTTVAEPAKKRATVTTSQELNRPLANAPDAPREKVVAVALAGGMSGATVKIVLASGEGPEGKEAQYVGVNDRNWLIPRNVPVIIPVEAYQVLTQTSPPAVEGVDANFYQPRFSVSVMDRYPAPEAR